MTIQNSSQAEDLATRPKEVTDRPRMRADVGRWQGNVRRIDDLPADAIALWRQLTATRHELRSPFFSFDFARAVAESGARARVCLLYNSGGLAGFFPFQFSSGLTQALAAGERIGGDFNDFCGVVTDRSRYGAIGTRDLLRCAGLASFEFNHLEETQPQLGLFGIRSEGTRIGLKGGLEAYWESVKTGHRSAYDTLRNRERKIAREFGAVDFVFAHEEPDKLLDLVVAEKRKQYERTGARDGFAEPWKLRCLEDIASNRKGSCIAVLSSLYLDGVWAALHLGIRKDTVLHSAYPVYNSQFGKLSPGLILLARIISEAPNQGVDEIDLSEGTTGYKSLFGTEFYPMYRGVWYRATARGIAYRAWLSAYWRLQALRKRQRDAEVSSERGAILT